jgi:alkylhydroperoxidase/carboxymuconolactone decarboxylase family protein YurZ
MRSAQPSPGTVRPGPAAGVQPALQDQRDAARYQRGLEAYASQFHIPPGQVPAWFADTVGGRFGEEAIQSAANAWTDDELSLRDRSLIVIAALIAQGDLEAQLRMHTRWALDHGATPGELEALATLLAIYTGFARASHGLMIMRDALSKLDAPPKVRDPISQ